MKCRLLIAALVGLLIVPFFVEITPAYEQNVEPADLVIQHAKVLTVDAKFAIAEAIAVKGDRILAVGSDADIGKRVGPKTTVIDAKGKTVMPGLYDSHTHPLGAATSEFDEELPNLKSLEDEFAYIRKKASELPEGEWIVLRFAFPTRFKEARFPTLAELDAAAPKHPVLHNAGPASMVNTMALKVSKVTKDTPNPANGVLVKDPKSGELTGMLRNSTSVLKGVPPGSKKASAKDRREAVKKLFAMYNSYGITSIADRNSSRGAFDLYHDLLAKDELTLRINVCPGFDPYGTHEQTSAVRAMTLLPRQRRQGWRGPTGKGRLDPEYRPHRVFLYGGMLATAPPTCASPGRRARRIRSSRRTIAGCCSHRRSR